MTDAEKIPNFLVIVTLAVFMAGTIGFVGGYAACYDIHTQWEE